MMDKIKRYITLLAVSILVSCTQVKNKEEAIPSVVSVEKPVVIIKDTKEKQSALENQSVLIVLSSQSPSYQKIADAISVKLKQPAIQKILSGQPASDSRILNEIEASTDITHIVTLGSKAARLVKDLKKQRIVFAQIVNYQDLNLVTDYMKGVSALPSPEKLFKDWRAISPTLSSVAIVAGKNLDPYLLRATKAAESQGIELTIEQVATDKEFIYQSKSLNPKIEGQWVLPDHRILSAKALKEVMAYASRRGRQVVVFSPKLLSFGGLFYVSDDANSIVDAVLQRITDSADKEKIPGIDVFPVMNHTMGINRNIAKQLNLNIPQEYQAYVNGE